MTDAERIEKIRLLYDAQEAAFLESENRTITVTSHARLNLEGAILDIEHADGQCDAVVLRTLNRVSQQLYAIERILFS